MQSYKHCFLSRHRDKYKYKFRMVKRYRVWEIVFADVIQRLKCEEWDPVEIGCHLVNNNHLGRAQSKLDQVLK